MPTLRKPKAVDATGAPLDATAVYECLSSHFRGHQVFPVGYTLRGDHPDVVAAPQLWIREDATSLEKRAARVAHVARRRGDVPEAPPDPTRPRILGPIPPERRRVALRNYHDRTGRIIYAGEIHDVRDEFVKANDGDLFGPVAA